MTDEESGSESGSGSGSDEQHAGSDDDRRDSTEVASNGWRFEPASGDATEDGTERGTDEAEIEDDSEDEWRFSLADLEEEADDENEDDEEALLGPEPNSTPVTPGSPSLENALFVVLGMLTMALVLVRLAAAGFGG